MRRILSFQSSTVGKVEHALVERKAPLPPAGAVQPLCSFEAVLRTNPGATASCTVRPLAADSDSHAGFPIGGEVTISGTADEGGLVGADGFPFLSPFSRYGLEVVAISGTGASVSARIGV